MRYVAALIFTLASLTLFVACGGPEESTESRETPETTTEESATSSQTNETTAETTEATALSEQTSSEVNSEITTVEVTSETGREEPTEVPASVEEAPFIAEPEASGGESGAAGSLEAVRFGVHEGYERVVLDFGADGGAASGVPRWNLSSPIGEGYARISLPDLASTSVSGGVFGSGVLGDFYVVRAPESSGGFFVDVFATSGFQYRAQELSEPGRLAVDFMPVGAAFEYPLPVRGESNVVTQPRSGARVSSPLVVSGYSRNFEGSTTVQLLDSNEEVVAESVVGANDWAETWGYFEDEIEFQNITGVATLRVGAPSPRDGSFEGVEVPITTGN